MASTFTPGMLSFTKESTKDSFQPLLKTKAHNTTVAVAWLADFMHARAQTPNERLVAKVMWAIAEMDYIMGSAGMWLKDTGVADLRCAKDVLLRNWNTQHDGSGRWHKIPKHHQLTHSVKTACETRRNPASHWNYAD